MIASRDLFEFVERELIGNECLASGKIDVKAVMLFKLELMQIVMAQMSDG